VAGAFGQQRHPPHEGTAGAKNVNMHSVSRALVRS
jgi:hypothetical protein